jgi:hypothetical protein
MKAHVDTIKRVSVISECPGTNGSSDNEWQKQPRGHKVLTGNAIAVGRAGEA